LNRGESAWAVATRFVAQHKLPLARLARLSQLLKDNVSEFIGTSFPVDPVFGEIQQIQAEDFPAAEFGILSNWEHAPEPAIALLREKSEREDLCNSHAHLRVLRNLALTGQLPVDFVRLLATIIASNLPQKSTEAIFFLCDAIKNYAEDIFGVFNEQRVLERVTEVETPNAGQAGCRLLLNVAAYSLNAPGKLTEVATALTKFPDVRSPEFVRACHICASRTPEAVEKLKVRADTIAHLSLEAGAEEELLLDLTRILRN
jgi:hypothetical protein